MEFSDLAKLASGHVEARIVQAAVELGIFDAVGCDASDARTVAKSLGIEPRATELMLNALAALKLLDKQADRFSLTQVSAKYLIRSAPEYLGKMIRFDAALWRCWEQLTDAVRTGQPVRANDMYQDHPTETEIFIGAMDSLVKARGDTAVIVNALAWEKVTALIDVGSGPATYPIALCRKYPKLRATIFDLPATMAITEHYVREAGLEERIRLIRGDFRTDEIPGSYDVVFLSNIIHGEGLEENQRLIANLCSILEPGGSMIIKDHVLDETRANPPVGAIFSLLMLLTTAGGRCYSFDEIKRWMELAGLRDVQQIDFPPPLTSSLVIAGK